MPLTLSAENNEHITIDAATIAAGRLFAPSRLVVSGLLGSSKAFFLARAHKATGKSIVAALASEDAAAGFFEDAVFFLGKENVIYYPSTEVLPFEGQSLHQDIAAARVEALFRLMEATGPFFMVTACHNLMERVIPVHALKDKKLRLTAGAEHPMETVISSLEGLGYTRVSMVEEHGEMSVRGGILDVFPSGFDLPLRIEFFGDIVESIRSFEISAQRSVKKLDEAVCMPASVAAYKQAHTGAVRERLIERSDSLGLTRPAWEPLYARLRDGSAPAIPELLPLYYGRLDDMFDYFGGSEVVIAQVEAELTDAAFKEFEDDVKSAEGKQIEKKRFFVDPKELYLDANETASRIAQFPVIRLEGLKGVGSSVSCESNIGLRQEITTKKGADAQLFAPLALRVNNWLEQGWRVYLTAHNSGQAERTLELLEGYELNPARTNGPDALERRGRGFFLATGALSTGFILPDEMLAIISEEEVFGERVKKRAPPSKKLEAFLLDLRDLAEGDRIVHAHHGIGLYRGLKRLTIDNVENDFLLLEYRDGDKLYLPVWRMDLVSKYHGVEGKEPALDKLGAQGWIKTKGKVKKEVEKMAGELLRLYAERRAAVGFAFSKPDRTFAEFEAGFEYDETPDQARAIEDTLKDMQEPLVMDRLVCGDVGYGKTEVAIRAAFKAALDGKQTAILVPTTVLAQQHYLTFKRRLAPFPVVVEALSRFKPPKAQKEIVQRVKQGSVDIIIGTHRLLQSDVAFKDLGLIVIDEEHRFGVRQKEKFKEFRKSVDCLTLTATPIPRTLHMSLSGVRDLSIINTPPEDRLAVKTSVIQFDEAEITAAIERELKRGGQVFFVHNRIESLGRLAEFLTRAVPHARVASAHGQMNEVELEKKMLGFVSREYDVLLSTAIIESGLDIPAANTIIINRADRFGLAELYQLRGRVGRSSHRAYAYFICPEPSELTPDARKRIEVIQELCDPGSGFKIATYDLEIRGAGEFLGTTQSGHIVEVGFEMYTELLEEAVMELKGEVRENEVNPEINMKVSQFIPDDYMPDARQRLGFYKRLASVSSEDELNTLNDELSDRYGVIPPTVVNLIDVAGLKLLLKKLKAKELAQKGARLYLTLGEYTGKDAEMGKRLAEKALKLVKKEPNKYRLMPDSRFSVRLPETLAHGEAVGLARMTLKELVTACGTVI